MANYPDLKLYVAGEWRCDHCVEGAEGRCSGLSHDMTGNVMDHGF